MNNKEVAQRINRCETELGLVIKWAKANPLARLNRHLTLYALIETHGTIELSIKHIIFDTLTKSGTPQLKTYLNENIKNRPFDIRYDNICKFLKNHIDDNWRGKLKKKIEAGMDSLKIKSALKTLHDTRNEFAHGGDPTISLNAVKECFDDAVKVIKILDILAK